MDDSSCNLAVNCPPTNNIRVFIFSCGLGHSISAVQNRLIYGVLNDSEAIN